MKFPKGEEVNIQVNVNRPSQLAIAKALGLSQASIVKYKRKGMPMASIEAAAAWHRSRVKITAHRIPRDPTPQPSTDTAATRAADLLELAARTLASGHDINALVPALRQALHDVPRSDRAGMLLPLEVMDVLTTAVQTLLAEDGGKGDDNQVHPMSDTEAAEMGAFWFAVAAGEARPA